MANRRLTEAESNRANAFLDEIRARLQKMSAGDPALLFAFRRRIQIRLMHDERGTPGLRRKLKAQKRLEQDGRCAICGEQLPEKDAELDRISAPNGYTPANTRLVHQACHRKQQADRNYSDE
jgi:hypothetical protein